MVKKEWLCENSYSYVDHFLASNHLGVSFVKYYTA